MTHRIPARAAFLFALAACSGADKSGTTDPNGASDDTGGADGAGDGGAADRPDPLSFDLHEAGPYQVGYAQITVDYDVLGETRSIPVSVWYPTEATTGEPVRYINLYVDSVSLGGAPATPPLSEAGYPVLLHSHGYQGFSGTSAFLMHHFASHGWVAIAPEHVDNLLTRSLDPLPTSHHVHRPLDMREALAATVAQAPSLLAGPIDLGRVAMSGHSFGVYTSWATAGGTMDPARIAAACAGDGTFETNTCTAEEQAMLLSPELAAPEVTASVLLAGGIRRSLFGDDGHRTVGGPMLSLTGSEDGTSGIEQFESSQGIDLTWVDLEGGCHQTFALGTCDTLPTEDGYRMVRSWSLAFLRHHLQGDVSEDTLALISGEVPVDPRAHTRVRVPSDP